MLKRVLGWFRSDPIWPAASAVEVRRRARLLVIDDQDFPYLELFRRDGYNITKWDDVTDLPSLERGDYDLLLLDIHGVGQEYSRDQGLGVLEHLLEAAPTVIVIAFSDADWSLEYKRFFDRADATLHKGADYVEFKRRIDELLEHRFSLEFYLSRIERVLGPESLDRAELREAARKAILARDVGSFRKYLEARSIDEGRVALALTVAQTAIGLLQILIAL